MTEATGHKQLWVRLATILGVWLIVGVVLAGQSVLVIYSAQRAYDDLPERQRRPNATTGELFVLNIAECALWAALTIGIFWLGRRYPLAQRRWWKSLAVHVPASLATAFL